MYRISKLGNKYYATEIDITYEEHIEEVYALVTEGTPVLIIDDLQDAEDILGEVELEII